VLTGVVIKAYSSYYYLQTGEKITMGTLRGRFKKERFSLLVGDEVEYSLTGEGKGIIENILPRHSMLKRPMVANVDQVMLIFAAVNPDINPALVDRFLVLAESSQLDTIIVINKTDIADIEQVANIATIYRDIGYCLIFTSTKSGEGIAELQSKLCDRITVFAGPSGAGKSSLLNTLQPGLALVTAEVSQKIGRGRHTTRYAELLPLSAGGFVVDTPGFGLTEFSDIDAPELTYYFPELARLAPECRFNTCLHNKEPQCAVKQALAAGKIARDRYESYLYILQEIQESKKGF